MTFSSAHAFTGDVLGRRDAVAIAELVQTGDISSIEIVEAAIARAEQIDSSISAIVVDCFDRARETAKGPLSGSMAGVPTFIKDMTDVEGMPTRYGTEALHRSATKKKTHKVAQQMFDMGMVCLGKSSMPEFGLTPSTEFPNSEPTRNPWNLDHSVGGSSGGAAALVAAGVIPIANATDGGGSIRIPAACCGLVGLKPSRNRLPLNQGAEPFVGILTDGVVTRTVRDTALFMAEAERSHPNPKLTPIGHVEHPLDQPLRIGAIIETPSQTAIDDVVRREFASCLELLSSLGHHVELISTPISEQLAEDFTTFWSLLALLVTSTGKRLIDPTFDKTRLTAFTQGLAKQTWGRVHKVPGAIYRLRRSATKSAELFAAHDVVLTPTVGQLTPKLGHLGMDLQFDALFPRVAEWACYTPYANATGGPSISLPLGHDDATNLPVGMMFGANTGQERLLLELALQLEAAAPTRILV